VGPDVNTYKAARWKRGIADPGSFFLLYIFLLLYQTL
jgi:hypothetical protein